jgi:hypothetical protein
MNDNDTTSVMYDHCKKVYEKMHHDAVVKAEGDIRMLVWEGFMTRLIQSDLGLAVPYYTAVRGHLTRMGCIRQLRRGGGNAKSQWEVIKEPTKEAFENAEASKSTQARARETHSAQINDLSKRVAKLENDILMLISAVNTVVAEVTTPQGTVVPAPRKGETVNGDDNDAAA